MPTYRGGSEERLAYLCTKCNTYHFPYQSHIHVGDKLNCPTCQQLYPREHYIKGTTDMFIAEGYAVADPEFTLLSSAEYNRILVETKINPLTGYPVYYPPNVAARNFDNPQIRREGFTYRTLWCHYHNEIIRPNCIIDHINGNRNDFRIWNLRCISKGDNRRNTRPYYRKLDSHVSENWYPPIPPEFDTVFPSYLPRQSMYMSLRSYGMSDLHAREYANLFGETI